MTTTLAPARTDRKFDLLSLGTFVIVGLPDGMLGTAWPAMRQSFGVPVGDLGLILLVNTVGSVVIAAFVGRLIQRLGVSVLLAVAAAIAALGGLGYALAPGLWLILTIGPLLGAAAGMMDGGLNTAIALTGRPRLMNLLHGFYGIGTAIGPLVVTAAILAGSWRPAYLLLVALDVAVAVLWTLHHRGNPVPEATSSRAPGEPGEADPGQVDPGLDPTDPAATWSRRRIVTVLSLGLIVFFVYTGLEVSAGQWETSYLRGHLGLSAGAAGLAAFGYWGALTAVRIGLALPRRPVPLWLVIGGGMAASVVATVLIWWQPDTAVVVTGFVILGGALAGIFPALISLTPQRIGERRAQHAIAWQVGAAAAGGSGISALLGLLIDHAGLAILGPAIVTLAVLLVVAYAALARLAPIPPARLRRARERQFTVNFPRTVPPDSGPPASPRRSAGRARGVSRGGHVEQHHGVVVRRARLGQVDPEPLTRGVLELHPLEAEGDRERWMYGRANARKVVEVATSSHCAMLSHPRVVAELILDAARAVC